MAIVNTIDNVNQFANEFRDIRPNNFSRAGLETLFEQLNELSESTGENIEFDPIALCCDFAEYSVNELVAEFDGCAEVYADADDAEQAVLEHAEECCGLITAADTVVIHGANLDEL